MSKNANKSLAIILAIFTAWPYLLFGFGMLIEVMGLIPESAVEPPPIFVLLMALICLTPIVVVAVLGVYLVYLFTRPNLTMDKKLVWAVILVVGHIFAMPVFWYLHIWKSPPSVPMQAASRFSVLVFAPLSIALLLPLAYIFPLVLSMSTLTLSVERWGWVLGPVLGAAGLFGVGRVFYNWLEREGSRRAAWIGLWAVFSVASFPVFWHVLVLLVGMVPTDHPADTWRELGVAAIVLALVAQPFVVGWLYAVSRMARKIG